MTERCIKEEWMSTVAIKKMDEDCSKKKSELTVAKMVDKITKWLSSL
jgi:hypothetical protein